MARPSRVRVAVAAVVWAGLFAQAGLGCSSILGLEPDRYVATSDASAGARGDAGKAADAKADGASDPWACVGAPPPGGGTNSPVDITLIVMDGLQPEISAGQVDGGSDLVTVSGTYLPGITVHACDLLDPGCSASSTAQVTDDAGRATFDLGTSFEGFFRLEGNVSGDQGVPVSLYPGPFIASDNLTSIPAYALSETGLQILTGSLISAPLALGPDAGAGHLLVNVYDCADHQAPGVKVAYSNAGGGQPFYFAGGIPSTMSTETDGYGLAGALNVPVGAQSVTATLASTGEALGTATVVVRPGEITWAWVRVRSH